MTRQKRRPADLYPYVVKGDGRVVMSVELPRDGSGQRRRKQFTGATYEAANAKRLAWLDEQEGLTVAEPGAMTFEQWASHWLRSCVGDLSQATIATYEVRVRKHMLPYLSDVRLTDLTTEMIESRLGRIATVPTYNQVVKTLRSILGEAVSRGHLVSNPAQSVGLRRPGVVEDKPFTDDEVKRILGVAEKRGVAARVHLAFYGLRQSEALGLRWADVNLDAGTVSVRATAGRQGWLHGCADPLRCGAPSHCPQRKPMSRLAETKTRASKRVVPVGPCAVDALCDLWERSGRPGGDMWVFRNEAGHPIDHRRDERVWARLLREAGVPHRRLHMARHTAATKAMAAGTDQATMMAMFGWSNSSQLARYAHPVTENIRKLGDLLDEF